MPKGGCLLDAGLVSAVREGRAVAFLGAGASWGAPDASGHTIPLGQDLKELIARRFLGGPYDAPFATVYDFAVTASSVRDVQHFIHETLEPFGPAPWHLLFPTFRWAGAVTTNYDLVIERAYEQRTDSAQKLAPFCMDADGTLHSLAENQLLYIKLHGCLTRYKEVDPPLIASTEQIINHIDGRAHQFAQFMEWAKTKTLIFIGYAMGDPNLRAIFDVLKKEGDRRNKYYLVRPNIPEFEAQYWQERRVGTQSLSTEQFLTELDREISQASRSLAAIANLAATTSFTRFIAKAGRSESAALVSYLKTRVQHVSEQIEVGTGEPARFYNGFDLGWYPIERELDVRRRLESAILGEQVIPAGSLTGPRFALIKSHAGGGKSVLLRRLAWQTGRDLGKLSFYAQDSSSIDVDMFDELASLVNQTIFLFIDDVTEGSEKLLKLLDWARSNQIGLMVIAGSRYNEWNVRSDHMSSRVSEVYELKYLTMTEIDGLLQLLERHECLGALEPLSLDARKERLTERYGRQLLVALHEATHNKSFQDIISDEYANIHPPEAQVLYRDVCAVNRLGPPVRAGLIARLHGITFEEFEQKFFKPLEEVVEAKFDVRVSDWVYRARHPQIAEMVYSVSLPTTAQRYENLTSIVSKLNLGYTYDEEVMSSLIRGNLLAELFSDRTMGAAIYDTIETSMGKTSFVSHQRGIYEMRLAGDLSALDRAEIHLTEALEGRTNPGAIRHSLAELNFKRSMLAKNELDREAFRRKAEVSATALSRTSSSSHAFHTLAKIALAELRDATVRSEAAGDDLSTEVLSQAIRKAEDALRTGLQKFPNDDRLLGEEATLNEILEKADRVLAPLQKAFLSNPKSELICRRLARVLLAKSETPEAIAVLQKGLDYAPGSQSLNGVMADAIRATAPNADLLRSADMLFHLRRSFAEGDRHYEAQFWYARQLVLSGSPAEAVRYFAKLKRLGLPFEQRRRPRGRVLNGDGSDAIYYGQVYKRDPTYGFIRVDGSPDLEVFFRPDPSEVDAFPVGSRAKFALEFTLSGPVASNLENATS